MLDIRNISASKLWLPIVTAACVVDTAGLFGWRYGLGGATADGPINTWYDRFGLVAYGADVLSMIIGIVLTQIVATAIGGPWSLSLFCAIAVVIQLIHDIVFAGIIVPAVPRGRNSIMDLMRTYATMPGAGGILVVDAIYMVLTAVIASALAAIDPSVSWFTLLVTLYATMYILYTKGP
jgi:hypothetical protein